MNIILKAQPDKSRNDPKVYYRLKISIDDYRNYFQNARAIIVIINDDEMTCTVPTETCPELRNARISEWIRENNFHNYPEGNPTEFQFSLTMLNDDITLTFQRRM